MTIYGLTGFFSWYTLTGLTWFPTIMFWLLVAKAWLWFEMATPSFIPNLLYFVLEKILLIVANIAIMTFRLVAPQHN